MKFDPVSYIIGKLTGGSGGGGKSAVLIEKSISENGEFNAKTDNADGYKKITVEVEPNLQTKNVTVAMNGRVSVIPDVDKEGLSSVEITVNAPGGLPNYPEQPKQVNFIDYNGQLLYTYTAQEANALTELPAFPTHSGLVAQGWNWTLQEIKDQLSAIPDGPVWVGQMYITQSGDTEIEAYFPDENRCNPILKIYVNGTVEIDWGDSTTPDTVTGTTTNDLITVPHTYSNPGYYTITIHVITQGYQSYVYRLGNPILAKTTDNSYGDSSYYPCIRKVRFGNGIKYLDNCTYYCVCLEEMTIPSGIIFGSWANQAFWYCQSLLALVLPSGMDIAFFSHNYKLQRVSLPPSCVNKISFSSCYGLESVTIPKDYIDGTRMSFYNCYSLTSVHLPRTITTIPHMLVYMCENIAQLIIPNSVTEIGDYAISTCTSLASIILPSSLETIGPYAFYSCRGLYSITIPSTVESIGEEAFASCIGLVEVHLEPTTPPETVSTIFHRSTAIEAIYVPTASVDAYKSAEGWSTYANLIVGE